MDWAEQRANSMTAARVGEGGARIEKVARGGEIAVMMVAQGNQGNPDNPSV